MQKTNPCCLLLSCLLVLVTITQPVNAQQADPPAPAVEVASATKPAETRQTDPQTEKVKIKIAKLGVGAKAKATIKLKNGSKTKGYIAQAGEDDFLIRDRKTDAPTTIRYSDVAKVEENQGHSTARNIAIGVGIGVGALLAAIFIAISTLD
ncbi:MAG: hypothetical protein ND895_17820 [Pyrinomonadaceae bacterium]|nr:hypothetical protein [Pyrinomonadaceae bacterium]